jgi:tetratricopeptide (TPR) repeat protein
VEDLPGSLRDLVVSAAEGNPFHIEELIKWLLEAGVITKDGETWHVRDHEANRARIPPTLRGVLQARLDALSPTERVTLQRAAVVGRVFWDTAVDSLAVENGPRAPAAWPTGEALDHMRAREVVYERPHSTFDDTREFSFKHALLRDVAYDSVLKAHRRRYHGLVATWLAQTAERSRRTDQYAGLIAGHHDQAGDAEAAAQWYLRAGRQATGVHALQEATRLLGRGLELAPDTDVELRFDLHLAREAVYERLGEREHQRADLDELDRLGSGIDDGSRQVELLLRRGHWAFNASDFAAQSDAARQAFEGARAAGLARCEVQARLLWGQALAWNSEHAAAREVLEEALKGARATGQPWLVGESLRYLAIVAGNQSEFTRSLELLEEALTVHRRGEAPDGEGLVLAQMGSTYYNQGRYREARESLELALPIFTASGYKYRQAAATANLGTVIVMQGELGTARRLLTEGLRVSREISDAEGTGMALGMLGELYRRVGDVDRAERYFRESAEIADDIGYHLLSSDSRVGLALLAIDRAEPDEALRLADEGREYGYRAESSFAAARALLARGLALLLARRLVEAEAAFRSGLARAEEMGVSNLALEARAGLARTAFERADLRAAAAGVEDLVERLEPDELHGCLQPADVLRTCWHVLAARDDPRAPVVLRAAGTYLDEIAGRIDEDDLRDGFLLRVPAHVELDGARREYGRDHDEGSAPDVGSGGGGIRLGGGHPG